MQSGKLSLQKQTCPATPRDLNLFPVPGAAASAAKPCPSSTAAAASGAGGTTTTTTTTTTYHSVCTIEKVKTALERFERGKHQHHQHQQHSAGASPSSSSVTTSSVKRRGGGGVGDGDGGELLPDPLLIARRIDRALPPSHSPRGARRWGARDLSRIAASLKGRGLRRREERVSGSGEGGEE
jgi:hypothetical protein